MFVVFVGSVSVPAPFKLAERAAERMNDHCVCVEGVFDDWLYCIQTDVFDVDVAVVKATVWMKSHTSFVTGVRVLSELACSSCKTPLLWLSAFV